MNLRAQYINLAHRSDRRLHMQQELARAGITATRFEAIRTTGFEWNRFPYKKMFHRTKGAIGCMLSQIEVMEMAYIAGKNAMVLEDDLIFCSDFQERLKMIEAFLKNKNWDVFWLGATVHVNPPYWHTRQHREMPECKCNLQRDAELTDHPNFLRTYGSFSTHAYIVNYKKIPGITEKLRDKMHTTIGIDYSFIRMAPGMENYCMVPGCVIQKDNQSDIGNGVTVFSGFSKLGAHWFADKIEQFDPLTYNWGEARL